MLGGVISNVHSLGTKLLHAVNQFSSQPSSSSSPPSENHHIETELKKLMDLLQRIKATLYDAEEREIRDESVKLWLMELRRVAYDAEDVLDEYNYEVLRAEVEARNASPPNSLKRKLIEMPDGMLDKIQLIGRNFDEIAQYRIALQLSNEEAPRRHHNHQQTVPTGHMVVESNIIGRQREKEELINLLCTENHDDKIISVVTMVGTGGIGKTTLAQLVYNDKRIRENFDKFGWVCVSENFNVQKLTKEVTECITGISCSLENLSVAQNNISEGVRDKRIFLVLDDVWNEEQNLWETFQLPFMLASMVKILVTTRNETVARIMKKMPTVNLDYISEEQSWQLFQHYAFVEVIQSSDSNLIKIGKQIVKKCGRLPLAVKSIACLLRHEPNEESWRDILESELWKSNARNEIFQPLKISYARLPTYLKPCFLYCSMFPKDHRYHPKELVNLWISQGYVHNNGTKNAEKVGLEYVKQLLHRSLFQEASAGYNFEFTLHDMVHDLARSISGHGCYSIEGDIADLDLCKGDIADLDLCKELYHLYVDCLAELVEYPRHLASEKFTILRTLIVCNYNWATRLVPEVKKLRALRLEIDVSFQNYSFVNLKHLRYLYLSMGDFERIPNGICSLFNLRYLTLEYCYHLTELIQCLYKLKYLKITRCDGLQFILEESLPLGLEEMEINWCVSLICVSGIQSLKSLVKLRITGCRKLRLLDRSGDLKTCEIDISMCPGLRNWCAQQGIIYNKDLISADEDDSDLSVVEIKNYNGRTFPDPIGDPTYFTCSVIKLYSCQFTAFLPFGGLDKLKSLRISECFSLEFIHEESLPLLLEEIEIHFCDNLISVTGIQRLKCLVKLDIMDCRNLCTLDHSGKADCIYVSGCPKLRELCLQHHIRYLDGFSL